MTPSPLIATRTTLRTASDSGVTQPCRAGRRTRRGKLTLVGALALLALLVAAGPAGAWTSQSEFLIRGHGWGHGIGMSQWGAYGYAKHGWTYQQILKHYYTGIGFTTVTGTDVRVLLQSGMASAKLSSPYAYTAQGTGKPVVIPAGAVATTTYVNGVGDYRVVATYTTTNGPGKLTHVFHAPVTFTPSRGALRVLTPTDLGVTGPYRGVVRIVRSGTKLLMIDKVPLESYLRGVVPREVSPSWPVASLRAQACAARAYALRSLDPGDGFADFDVFCDVRDQAYAGVGVEDPATDAAVSKTAGVVPTYGGSPIAAYYFSCSGGLTENIEDGWPGAAAVPYLKGVDDRYDSYGSLHDWGPLRRTAAQVAGPLGATGSLRAVYTVKRGSSPRIVKAALISSTGVKFMDGNELRMKLGLNSTWAVFRSMSINPSPQDDVTITPDASMTLKGRVYPALPAGATVHLFLFNDGRWRSRHVPTTRHSESLGGGYTATYSSYSDGISPVQTTKYYFASGFAHSPTITVTVK